MPLYLFEPVLPMYGEWRLATITGTYAASGRRALFNTSLAYYMHQVTLKGFVRAEPPFLWLLLGFQNMARFGSSVTRNSAQETSKIRQDQQSLTEK